MESSMSNDPVLARLFDAMYNEPIPPRVIDNSSRTTIWTGGTVCLWHDDGVNPLQFWGVYNFNGDKGDLRHWGHYPGNGFERSKRFEVNFNASDHAVAFVKPEGISEEDWYQQLYEGFEPKPDEVYTPEMFAELKEFVEFISDADFDTEQGRQDFRTEFQQRAKLEYFLKYLVAIITFGSVDQFGKDMLLNIWDDGEQNPAQWWITMYDMDSVMGIDNQGRMRDSEGNLLFDYNMEMEDVGVFAQADSKLWEGMFKCFPEEIKATYAELRNGVFAWDNVWGEITDYIGTISKSLYNAHAIQRYIEAPGANDWLWMMNGDRLNQMNRWLSNRYAYLDSKYDFDTNDKSIVARFEITNASTTEIKARSSIHLWMTAQLGNASAGFMKDRVEAGEVATLTNTYGAIGLPFVEFELFSGQYITELVDWKDLPIVTLQLGDAEQLQFLDLSKTTPDSELQSISFGNNRELLEINLRNNTALTGLVDLSQSTRLNSADLRDTNLTSALLPEGGVLEELRLPSSITGLRLVNQTYLTTEGFELQGSPNLESLRIENTPNIDPIELLQYVEPNGAVRITNIQLVTNKTQFLDDLVDMLDGRQGIDSNGNFVANPVFTGNITIYAGSDFDQSFYQSQMPNITFNHIILPEGLTYTFVGGGTQVSGYTGNAATLIIPESVPQGLDEVDYVLGSEVQISPVTTLGGTNTFGSTMQNLFIPSTVIATSGTPLASEFTGRIMTSHSEKPAGWNIDYENILYNERPFIESGDFFVRIYNNDTEIELLTMIGSNIELVTVPRSVEGLTITTIPANTILGTPRSIYIPNSITAVSADISGILFVLTESSEVDEYVTGANVTWNVSDSLKTYTITYNYLNETTDIYVQNWYAFIGLEEFLMSVYYVDGVEINIPYTSIGDASIDIYEIPDYRTFSYDGASYTLDSVIIDAAEPLGSYILVIPDEHDDGVNGLKACNPSATLFTDENFPASSRERIKEIYYHSNISNSAVIPGFSNSTIGSQVTSGFLGNSNFPDRDKLVVYTKKISITGMRDGDTTEVYFTNPDVFDNANNLTQSDPYGLAENKLTNVDEILQQHVDGGRTVLFATNTGSNSK